MADFQEVDYGNDVDNGAPVPRQPTPRFMMTDQRQPQSQPTGQKMPDLTLSNAYKILKFYQDEPEWLADPRTSNVANADFAQASKIIGINMQLERLSNQSETARARNSMERQVGTSLLKLAESGPEGAKVAAKWYAQGDSGEPLYKDPSKWANILSDYEAVVPVVKPGAEIHEQRFDEYILDLKNSGDSEKMKQAERHEAILTERGRPKVGAGPEQTSIQKQEADVAGLKASVIQAKRFALAKPDDPKLKSNANALQTRLAGSEAKLSELRKQSATSPATPAAAPAASAPSVKRPTKAIAADYVQRLGRDKAIEALKQEGYDTSGYAD